jgi:molecular chaperone DnaK
VTAPTISVDFGTTFTVAALRAGAFTGLVGLEPDAADQRMSSSVALAADGSVAVGAQALAESVPHPERYEPALKKVLGWGELLLGDRVVPLDELVGSVMARSRVAGADPVPDRIVVTHPATWGSSRTDVLVAAARRAGFADVDLLSEPVAAATAMGRDTTRPGARVAVCDFGGGSFDIAILERTSTGFDLLAAPVVWEGLSGEEVDARVVEHLTGGPLGEHPDWAKLLYPPPDEEWLKRAIELRAEVRRAKEGLSAQTVWQLRIPGLERDFQLSRVELEDLIRSDVEAGVQLLLDALAASGLDSADLADVYLLGGCSRIPLVSGVFWDRLGCKPTLTEAPESVVALGAVAWRPGPGRAGAAVAPGAQQTWASRLALATKTVFWNSGAYCYGYVTVVPDGSAANESVRFSDEPSTGDLDQLVSAAGEHRAAHEGYRELAVDSVEWMGLPAVERWMILGGESGEASGQQWVERYLLRGSRIITGLAPARLSGRLEAVTLVPPSLAPESFYQLPFSCGVGETDRVYERLELIRVRTHARVTAESCDNDPAWSDQRVEALRSHPGYTWLKQSSRRLLGAPSSSWQLSLTDGVPGQIHSFWSAADAGSQQTRLWVGRAAGRSYSVVASLPEREKISFPLLLAHVTMTKPNS